MTSRAMTGVGVQMGLSGAWEGVLGGLAEGLCTWWLISPSPGACSVGHFCPKGREPGWVPRCGWSRGPAGDPVPWKLASRCREPCLGMFGGYVWGDLERLVCCRENLVWLHVKPTAKCEQRKDLKLLLNCFPSNLGLFGGRWHLAWLCHSVSQRTLERHFGLSVRCVTTESTCSLRPTQSRTESETMSFKGLWMPSSSASWPHLILWCAQRYMPKYLC